MGRPTKHELKSSTADVAPVVPLPPAEQPSKSTAKLPVAAPAPGAARSSFTTHQRHGDRRDSDSGDDDPADDILLRSAAVRRRYRCSDMWLHRRLHDDSRFPRPIYIGRDRYWRLSDLLAWERAQAERPVPKARILEHRDAARAARAERRARNPQRHKPKPHPSPET
jgi:hypothetical protein